MIGLDDFRNSAPGVLESLRAIDGRTPEFVRADVGDAAALDAHFGSRRTDAVVHFSAFKEFGESAAEPLRYYRNNVGGLVTVCVAMRRHGCRRMVFRSSATVYGEPQSLPI